MKFSFWLFCKMSFITFTNQKTKTSPKIPIPTNISKTTLWVTKEKLFISQNWYTGSREIIPKLPTPIPKGLSIVPATAWTKYGREKRRVFWVLANRNKTEAKIARNPKVFLYLLNQSIHYKDYSFNKGWL